MANYDVQLIMRWENNGEPAKELILPNSVTVDTFNKRENALNEWLDIVQYGLTDGVMDEEFYHRCMTDRPFYNDKMCYFIVKDGKTVATITIICDYEKSEGYIHMVACKPECRGQGLGTLLNDIAISALKSEKMKTAYLTTDDFRIPAIKSYLRCGFTPDLSTDEFKERWAKIMGEIEK